jgi:hypothetical protein
LCFPDAVEFENGIFPAFAAGEGKIFVQDPRFFLFSGLTAAGSELRRNLFFCRGKPHVFLQTQSGSSVFPWLDLTWRNATD